jgi:hypothetical protein
LKREVSVYPDNLDKPHLGEGLKRPAQIKMDKLLPLDKISGDPIRSTDRLINMSYKEKLEKASSRMGARFLGYRPETGSWVFKVDHFSKYNLDENDSDTEIVATDNDEKFKTLENFAVNIAVNMSEVPIYERVPRRLPLLLNRLAMPMVSMFLRQYTLCPSAVEGVSGMSLLAGPFIPHTMRSNLFRSLWTRTESSTSRGLRRPPTTSLIPQGWC